ncbi:hypothetical protein [Streptomyces sp. NPDC001492]
MTETEDALRRRIADLEAQLAAQPYIPALPAEHDGEAITWRPWEEAPVILCARAGDLNGCTTCGHPGPSLIAFGLAGPGKPLIRFNAHRCPGCQEMRVYQRVYEKGRIGVDLNEVAYSPPRTIARTETPSA